MSRIGERRKHAQAEPSAGVFQHSGYERASMNDVAGVFVEIFLHGLVTEPEAAQ